MNQTIELILFLSCVTIIVAMISNIELFVSKRKAIYSSPLTKNFVYLKPSETGLKYSCWIYNSKNIKARNIPYPQGFNKNNYSKDLIEEHLASRLNRPIIDFFQTLANITKTKMPMNMLYNAIMKGEIIASNADPIANQSLSTYKIIHSKQDHIETFISGDRFYII